MGIGLSLIIPAYNETQRLPAYLRSIHTYLSSAWGDRYEVLVVDDGSEDGLPEVVQQMRETWPQLGWLRHAVNRGKGAAVRTGVLAAAGELLLFADADGATPIEEERHLRAAIERGADVVVGSRLLPSAVGQPDRPWSRAFCGQLFAALVRWLFALPVRDTQCGFKMFTRAAAQELFCRCRDQGYMFDVEVLAWAVRRGLRIAEVPVRWTDMPGSKVRLLRDGCRMVHGLLNLRRRLQLPAQGGTNEFTAPSTGRFEEAHGRRPTFQGMEPQEANGSE